MRLYENKRLFKNLIDLTAQKTGMPYEVIEKDYFVVLALKLIYTFYNDVIFIGGTALSKCFNIINRFSEDVDLVSLFEGKKAAQKHTHKIINYLKAAWPWTTTENNKLTNDFKVMYLEYFITNNTAPLLENRIRLELISFLTPFPLITKKITPYVTAFMTSSEVVEYEITSVTVQTQAPYRTFFEKIIIQKELYVGFLNNSEEVETQIKRARDFYDIYKLWEYYGRKLPFTKEEFALMINTRIKNRGNRVKVQLNGFDMHSLIEMYRARNIRLQLETIDKTKLTISDLDCNAIEEALHEIDKTLITLISTI